MQKRILPTHNGIGYTLPFQNAGRRERSEEIMDQSRTEKKQANYIQTTTVSITEYVRLSDLKRIETSFDPLFWRLGNPRALCQHRPGGGKGELRMKEKSTGCKLVPLSPKNLLLQ